jgi:hypothetical protein
MYVTTAREEGGQGNVRGHSVWCGGGTQASREGTLILSFSQLHIDAYKQLKVTGGMLRAMWKSSTKTTILPAFQEKKVKNEL